MNSGSLDFKSDGSSIVINRRLGYLYSSYYLRNTSFLRLGIAFSFALMQKKQKIKDNPIAPRVCPGLRSAKAGG